jgi:hypothetical protein
MARPASLETVQRWMQEVVVHPATVEDAVASPRAQAEVAADRIGDVILPSPTLTSVERVGIYHGMYLLRMEEALQSDYPALQHFLGDDAFRGLVEGYVQKHPSRSFTLNRLGDHLPEYVAAAPGVPRPAFCHDLARLEQAVAQVFDAPETPALTEAEIAAVPADVWERARLEPVAAFRLLAFRYPVNAYLSSVRDEDHHHPKTRRGDSWVAVYRREYAVWRLDLDRPAHDLLADLAAGQPLGDAVQAALRRGRGRVSQDDLFRWFRNWMSNGLFRRVVGLEGLEPSTSRL